ncbi:MAG TPA: response regulator [Bauldia sp.]|nr:response regulator [Bauldia sp.]
MKELAGKRIFVVEDEALVAAMIEDMLTDAGAAVIGPAATIARSLDLAACEAIDVAILDVNVRGERIDPVVEVLRGRGVPVVFATGYGQAAGAATAGAPVLDKPYTPERLIAALRLALATAAS